METDQGSRPSQTYFVSFHALFHPLLYLPLRDWQYRLPSILRDLGRTRIGTKLPLHAHIIRKLLRELLGLSREPDLDSGL